MMFYDDLWSVREGENKCEQEVYCSRVGRKGRGEGSDQGRWVNAELVSLGVKLEPAPRLVTTMSYELVHM